MLKNIDRPIGRAKDLEVQPRTSDSLDGERSRWQVEEMVEREGKGEDKDTHT